MTKTFAVIGANWGDEGKGLMTNYLASHHQGNNIVVRSNGGAQAGHTVVLADGRRHVFSHFGSATLQGVPTYLSEYFISNPKTFFVELEELRKLGVEPKVFADCESPITTPYDMIINQVVEAYRSEGALVGGKHGSCGLGINETVKRSEHPEYKVDLWDIMREGRDEFTERINRIKNEWFPARLKALNIGISADFNQMIQEKAFVDKFIDQCYAYFNHVELIKPSALLKYDNIIFEGAQGLLLHENSKFFPHVTHSKTGIENCIKLCDEIGIKEITPVYMSRCYMTRHGAGPMPNELPEKPYEGIVDETNVPNKFQDSLRYSLLDLDLLKSTINFDIESGILDSKCKVVSPILAITCLDQLTLDGNRTIRYIQNKEEKESDIGHFLKQCFQVTGNLMMSYGATGERIFSFTYGAAMAGGVK